MIENTFFNLVYYLQDTMKSAFVRMQMITDRCQKLSLPIGGELLGRLKSLHSRTTSFRKAADDTFGERY